MTAAQGIEWLTLITRTREAGRPGSTAGPPPSPNPPPQLDRLSDGLTAKGFPEQIRSIVWGLAQGGALRAADALDLLSRTKGRQRR